MDADLITVEVRGADRVRVGQIDAADLTGFLCVHRKNSVGSWSLKLPDKVLSDAGVLVRHKLCWELRQPSAGLVITGPDWVLSGPMIYAAQEQVPEDPDGTWTFEGVSDLVFLARPTAFPDPAIGTSQASSQSRASDTRTAAAETLMRTFVRLNVGEGAPANRRLAGLTSGTDLARGGTLTKSPRFDNLLELLQKIALGSNLLFDVIQVGDGLEFRVSVPVDVSSEERWDVDNGQLSRAKYGFTAPGCTRVFVAGQGEGTLRTIVEVTTAASLISEAVWGRIERFVDHRNTDDLAELTQAGLEILAAEGSAITSLEVVPSADLAEGFGSRWLLGSVVTVVVGDQEILAPVTEVPVMITPEGLFIGATVGDPTGFDWESTLSSRQSKTEARLSALERTSL